MNKIKLIFVGTILITLAIAFILVMGLLVLFGGPPVSFDENILLDNQEAFTSLAMICYEHYRHTNSDLNERFTYAININNEKLICYTNNDEIKLDNSQLEFTKKVLSVFKLAKKGLDRICVYESFIVFGIVNGRASFIYSLNNKKPSFVNRPDETASCIFVDEITTNWYYACK